MRRPAERLCFNGALYYTLRYASWEKGPVENIDGLLRQYFPKGTSFVHCRQSEARPACQQINKKARKILNRKSPQSLRKRLAINTWSPLPFSLESGSSFCLQHPPI